MTVSTLPFVETPIYDSLLGQWKRDHDGREPGDVLVEEAPRSMPPRPRARKPRASKAKQ